MSDLDASNPYRPPSSLEGSVALADAAKGPVVKIHRRAAWITLGLTVIAALLLILVTEVLTHRVFAPGMILLLGSSLVAVVLAYYSRDYLVAPLCCFAAMLAGDLLAGVISGWDYAEPIYVLPLATLGSLPALIVALLRMRSAQRANQAID